MLQTQEGTGKRTRICSGVAAPTRKEAKTVPSKRLSERDILDASVISIAQSEASTQAAAAALTAGSSVYVLVGGAGGGLTRKRQATAPASGAGKRPRRAVRKPNKPGSG